MHQPNLINIGVEVGLGSVWGLLNLTCPIKFKIELSLYKVVELDWLNLSYKRT